MLLPSLLGRRLFSSLATASAAATSHHVSPLTFSDTWAPATVSHISPATSDHTLFHLTLNLSSHPSLAARHVSPGQFLPLRLPSSCSSPPLLLSIASPPHVAQLDSEFELLVKRVSGSVSDALCGMREGDLIEVGEVMGKGFEIRRLWTGHAAGDDVALVLMFATGSGIRFNSFIVFPLKFRCGLILHWYAAALQSMNVTLISRFRWCYRLNPYKCKTNFILCLIYDLYLFYVQMGAYALAVAKIKIELLLIVF